MIGDKMTDVYNETMKITGGCVVTLDASGQILRFRSHMEEIPEKNAADMAGINWFDIFLPVKGPKVSRHFFKNVVLKDKYHGRAHTVLTSFRDDLFIEWNFIQVRDDGKSPSGILGVGQNITRYVRSEKKLLQEKFSLIEENKELKCLYGITKIFENPDQTLESILQAVAGMLPPAFQFHDIACAKIQINGKSYTSGNFKPSRHTISENILVEKTVRGTVAIAYPEDKFPKRKNRSAFLKEERRLLKAVAQQLAFILEKKEVNDKHIELERQLHHADRLATVGQLAAGIAHELNDPINNILGYAQLSSKHPDLPEQVYMDLDNIVRFSLHAREIVKKVMLFSRQMPPRRERVDLNKVIDESLYFTEPLCNKAGIEMNCELSPNLPKIMADPSQLRQVIVNLIVNAAQAMPKSGGTISIRTGSSLADNAVYFKVTDSGIGMSAETLMQCFMPFFTTKDIDQGTGLGLSVVHGIIQAHGGAISADSQEGKGATFTITFPIKTGKGDTDAETEQG